MTRFRPCRFAVLYAVVVAMALAQTAGLIARIVLDASGTAVPGATITLIRDDTVDRTSLASEPTGTMPLMTQLIDTVEVVFSA